MITTEDRKPSLLSLLLKAAARQGWGSPNRRKEQFRSSQLALPIIDSHTLRMMMLKDQESARLIMTKGKKSGWLH